MTYGEAVVSVLRGNSGVTDLAGSGTAARVYAWPLQVDKGMPAVTYRMAGGPGESFVSDGQTEGMELTRFEFSGWGATQTAARAMAKAARSALHGWRGMQGTLEIQLIACEGQFDLAEPETGIFRTAFFADVTFTTR